MSVPTSVDGERDRTPVAHEPMADEIRRLLANGWRVESQTEQAAVMVKGRTPEHILHLVLTLLTFGLWAAVWIALALTKHEHRMVLTAP